MKISELTPHEKAIQEFCCAQCKNNEFCPYFITDKAICPGLSIVLVKKYIKENKNAKTKT